MSKQKPKKIKEQMPSFFERDIQLGVAKEKKEREHMDWEKIKSMLALWMWSMANSLI